MTNNSVHVLRSSKQCPSDLLRMGEASSIFKVSHATLRKWNREKKLQCVRTVGNTRLVVKQSLLKCLGIEDSVSGKSNVTVCYCRCSTSKQNGDLARQIEKVSSFVIEKYGVEPIVYSEIGSGLSDSRPKYLKLIEDVVEQKIGRIVCNTKDRLSRYGNEVFGLLCQIKGVDLVFVDDENVEKSYSQELSEDLMSIVHVYSCRHYSRRAAETLRRDVEDEVKVKIMEMFDDGFNFTEIARELTAQGVVCPKDGMAYSTYVIRKTIYEAVEKEKLKPSREVSRPDEELVKQFIAECCTVTKDAKVFTTPLYQAYEGYANKIGRKSACRKRFSDIVRQMGFTRKFSTSGMRVYKGLFLTHYVEGSTYCKQTRSYGSKKNQD